MNGVMARRAARTRAIADELVALFDASGVEYTCVMAIRHVIERPAMAAVDAPESAGLGIRWRRPVNIAIDLIHAREYPKKGEAK